ncbi:MAG: ribonuclease PH [Verrucomicrobiae bacterium]|nr:ribonuclease PH [Verrucomicrobiae bacterium]
MTRPDNRQPAELRPLTVLPQIAPHATGSVLMGFGNTRVICAVSIEEGVPRWMKEQQVPGGWITAEYSMLPYSTVGRKPRDISKGKIDGRSQEIQRLIGRSLRAAVDLEKIGPRTIWIDCDVLQADGGTRTASITGAYIALSMAVAKLMETGKLASNPIRCPVAAVSVGIFEGQPVLDLNYIEDSQASVDMNVVMTGTGEFIELQGSGEESTFSESEMAAMLALAKTGINRLVEFQREALQ